MNDSNTPSWLKYSVALVIVVLLAVVSEIPDFELPSPQDPGWTPLIGLVHALAAGAGFGLIVFVASVWSNRPRGDNRKTGLRRGVYAFLILGGGRVLPGIPGTDFS